MTEPGPTTDARKEIEMFTRHQTRILIVFSILCLVLLPALASAQQGTDIRKLNHDLDGWSVHEYAVSNDGRWVVYRTDDYGSGLEALYSVPTSGSTAPVMLAAQTGGAPLAFDEFAITPDSARVVWRGDLQTDGVHEIFSRVIDGGTSAVKLNHPLDGWAVHEFQISGDGSRVVYLTDDYGSGLGALYSVPTDGSAAPVMLAAQTGGAPLAFDEFAITPDSARVVWRGDLQTDGVHEIFSREIDGSSGAVKLNHSLGGWAVHEFQISGDGSRVVYRTDDYGSGLGALYSVPADGSSASVMLAAQTGGATLAFHEYAITPDGARVVWRGDLETNGVDELFSRPIDGGQIAVKLNHDLHGWSVLDFKISNDSSLVVFRTDDYGSGLEALYSVAASGLWDPITLAQQTGGATRAFHEYAISPDSSRVIWRGDLETDGVDELFSRSAYLYGDVVKLNHDLGGWSVLDFEISVDGTFIVYHTDDYGSGLEALYRVSADRSDAPEMLVAQTNGAALAFHEYSIGPTGGRIFWRGDLETDGEDELFLFDYKVFMDGFESGSFSAWSGVVM
jgi:Tol biopolymer transport system component